MKALVNPIKYIKKMINTLLFSIDIIWKAVGPPFIVQLLICLLTSVIPMLGLWYGKKIIDLLSLTILKNNDENSSILILSGLIGVMLFLELANIILKRTNTYFTNKNSDIVGYYINKKIFNKINTLDISFFDSHTFYDDVSNVRRDSNALKKIVDSIVVFIQSIIQFTIAIIVLSNLAWYFSLILVVLSVPSILAEKKFAKVTYKWQKKRVPEERKMSYIQNVLTHKFFAIDIRLFKLYNVFLERYSNIWTKWFKEKRQIEFKKWAYKSGMQIFPILGGFYIMFYAGYRIIRGTLTIGDFSLYNGVYKNVISAINNLMFAVVKIYDNEMRINTYKDFFNIKPRYISSGSLKLEDISKIEFRNVSFEYPDTNKKVLKNVSFKFDIREKVAIVGWNGAGKTTLVKLLLRFYEPNEGVILVNGIDVRKYNIENYRSKFTAILQDYPRYAFSLRENITISDVKNSDNLERINEACKISGIEQVVNSMEEGLDTYLTRQFSEKGEELSGGNWQKIALARAFFRDTNIVVLDEPTASLDPEAESVMLKNYFKVCNKKGTIIISHRLSNIIEMDKIMVLENGKVVEVGRHEELMKNNGRYAYLFKLQAEKYTQ
ncbi:ABC transporter ATP-binding protein [Herbivorax sp. ANBcel31]|uniref:ABC transporter ATP-binding protein n=1 Tax=Herbivorax sp. ANBcel31 TaxID=3069754 RepID=UPI0027B55D51|nr:ABC transporter ATP-binding protein [Herbivorax sp. ANBcel31]MDQ2086412.1 ABC transporter ATP-binding protein [Herbivorax sp. ANBcel31]